MLYRGTSTDLVQCNLSVAVKFPNLNNTDYTLVWSVCMNANNKMIYFSCGKSPKYFNDAINSIIVGWILLWKTPTAWQKHSMKGKEKQCYMYMSNYHASV